MINFVLSLICCVLLPSFVITKENLFCVKVHGSSWLLNAHQFCWMHDIYSVSSLICCVLLPSFVTIKENIFCVEIHGSIWLWLFIIVGCMISSVAFSFSSYYKCFFFFFFPFLSWAVFNLLLVFYWFMTVSLDMTGSSRIKNRS